MLDDGGTFGVACRPDSAARCKHVSALDDGRPAFLVELKHSIVAGVYDTPIDRDSAHEALIAKRAESTEAVKEAVPREEKSMLDGLLGGGRRQGAGEALFKSAARAIGSEIGRRIARGVLGSILGGTSTRRRR